ncbi:MAG: protein-tyrosine-phosphatase [Cytophagales bacterium]|nr:MAG: protein-tyrosine-phosphatase [Cytophagales bacterium]
MVAEGYNISPERKATLDSIAHYIQVQYQKKQPIALTFICTHNSRRSQFGQVWAYAAALYHGLPISTLRTYSGGTEATACNIRTIEALKRAGFTVNTNEKEAKNPVYEVLMNDKEVLSLFSKQYAHASNPQENFCAVLVCSQADEACPIVKGAEKRIYLPYEDPKKADGSEAETNAYDATCKLIAQEMLYVFSKIQP